MYLAEIQTRPRYKIYGKCFRRSKAPYSVGAGPMWPKFELFRDFMPVKFEKNLIKNNRENVETSFPHYKSMGTFCFDPICLKTKCSLSPTPVMLHIKFYQDWPTGLRDIQVKKCGRRRRRTDGGLSVYYKFICEPSAQMSWKLVRHKIWEQHQTHVKTQLFVILELVILSRMT